jgi:hypothetical protein
MRVPDAKIATGEGEKMKVKNEPPARSRSLKITELAEKDGGFDGILVKS